MSPRFDALTPNDCQRLRELNEVFAQAFEDAPSYAGAPPSDAYLRELLASPTFIALVAVIDGRVIGGLTAYVLSKAEQERREIYLYDLAVLADFRRRSIGRNLIRELCRIGRQRGAYVVFVQADEGDDIPIALYSSLGKKEHPYHFDIELDSDEP
ncbi:MAG: GNAT family N-acetyltransferase [Polyangiaceae bacterium]